MLHDAHAWSASAVYAWWLCVRLVVVPILNMRAEAVDQAHVVHESKPADVDAGEGAPEA